MCVLCMYACICMCMRMCVLCMSYMHACIYSSCVCVCDAHSRWWLATSAHTCPHATYLALTHLVANWDDRRARLWSVCRLTLTQSCNFKWCRCTPWNFFVHDVQIRVCLSRNCQPTHCISSLPQPGPGFVELDFRKGGGCHRWIFACHLVQGAVCKNLIQCKVCCNVGP